MNPSARYAIAADKVFDGTTTRQNAAVVVEGERIVRVLPRSDLPSDLDVETLSAADWLAPGFIDIQVNGGGDVLFNDAPTPETIATVVAAHRRFGTTSLLPTLITDSEEKMRAAILAAEAMVGVEPGVLGIHLEGPFLSLREAWCSRRQLHSRAHPIGPGPSVR